MNIINYSGWSCPDCDAHGNPEPCPHEDERYLYEPEYGSETSFRPTYNDLVPYERYPLPKSEPKAPVKLHPYDPRRLR